METRVIKIGGVDYKLKFGLGSLILLSKKSKLDVEDIILYGLQTLSPQANKSLLSLISYDEKVRAEEAVSEIFSPSSLPSPQTIEEWYRKGIGEIGLSLSDFYCLTPYELDLAYEGYLRRMELVANLNQLAFLRALNKNDEPITLTEEREYSMGSIEERERVLANLGLKECK